MKNELSHIKKTFIRQHSENYCGLACLTSIVRYYGGNTMQEKLAGSSGTTFQGTTLLGLYQTAQKMGFDAEGYEADLNSLKEIHSPVILHVIKEDKLEHFVVCYGYHNEKFLIGDPGWGIIEYREDELDAVWKTKALLMLTPNAGFVKKDDETRAKIGWVKALVKEDIPVLAIAAFLGVLLAFTGLAIAFFSQKLIDQILPQKDTGKLMVGLILLLLVLWAKGFLGYIRGVFLIRQGRDFNNRVVGFFFEKLMFLPKSFFDGVTSGDMISRLNDTSRMRQTIIKFTSGILIDLLVVIATSTYIFFLSPSTGLLSLTAIPVFGFIAWHYNGKIIKAQRAVMQLSASTQSKYIDTIQRIEVIKGSNKEEIFSKLIKQVYGLLQNQIYRLGLLGNRIGLTAQIFNTLIMTCIIGWASFQVLHGALLIGQMMAILSLIGSFIGAVASIAMSNIDFQEARVAFDRMYEFAAAEPEYEQKVGEQNTSVPIEGFDNLEIKNLNFRYPGKSLLLKNLNLYIKKEKIITIFGEIGCGKSTLLSILQRFYPYETGDILINGKDWKNRNNYEWRNMVAVVSQQVKLFNGTILENIGLSDISKEKEIVGFCKETGLHDFIMGFQQGYATIIHENSVNISGGQQQLIAIARALYQKPQLLLLDEATAAMDRCTEQFVLKLLQQKKKEMMVIFVTHRVQLARHTDYIYVIENKQIATSGTHKEVIQNNRLYRETFEEIVLVSR
ncbi:MAG: peptidase domain-containing ABC transporter [Bacteroidia bacterium]|nr:peptidase domain-containing ABC transporter [Bacteroidia bacterium]